MANMKNDGGQGKAAPVNTAQPIKAGTPSDKAPGGAQVVWGEHSGGSANNDRRAAK